MDGAAEAGFGAVRFDAVEDWRLSRHRTAVWLRWAAIGSAMFEFLAAQPPPLSRTRAFALCGVAAAYNVLAWVLGRRRGRLAARLRAAIVVADFGFAVAFVLLLLTHPTAVAYFAFTLVGIEAGILYTVRGFLLFTAALLPTLGLVYVLQQAGGVTVPLDDWLYVPGVVLAVSAMVAVVTRNLDRQHAEVVRLSITDSLTGLANTRAFRARLESEVRRARRQGLSLSLLTLDLDYFKRVNDTRGHLAGDEALRSLGRVLNSGVLRADVDFAARVGGEEFCVVLPATHLDQAVAVGERIRAAVAAPGSGVSTTASVGAAELMPDESAAGLTQRSDLALYAAKERGRNRVAAVPVGHRADRLAGTAAGRPRVPG